MPSTKQDRTARIEPSQVPHVPPRPRVHVFDPAFRYTASHDTDLRATFARERERLAQAGKQTVVTQIKKGGAR